MNEEDGEGAAHSSGDGTRLTRALVKESNGLIKRIVLARASGSVAETLVNVRYSAREIAERAISKIAVALASQPPSSAPIDETSARLGAAMRGAALEWSWDAESVLNLTDRPLAWALFAAFERLALLDALCLPRPRDTLWALATDLEASYVRQGDPFHCAALAANAVHVTATLLRSRIVELLQPTPLERALALLAAAVFGLRDNRPVSELLLLSAKERANAPADVALDAALHSLPGFLVLLRHPNNPLAALPRSAASVAIQTLLELLGSCSARDTADLLHAVPVLARQRSTAAPPNGPASSGSASSSSNGAIAGASSSGGAARPSSPSAARSSTTAEAAAAARAQGAAWELCLVVKAAAWAHLAQRAESWTAWTQRLREELVSHGERRRTAITTTAASAATPAPRFPLRTASEAAQLEPVLRAYREVGQPVLEAVARLAGPLGGEISAGIAANAARWEAGAVGAASAPRE
jgi:hypothetical protein